MKYYSVIKKNKIMTFAATQMQLEILILSKVSQKERQTPYGITYMWNLKYDTNEPIHKIETDSTVKEYRLMIAKGEGIGRRMDWEVGASKI